MSNQKPTIKNIVIDFLRKHPNISTMGAAKLLHKQMPDVFRTVNNARTSVQFVRDELGPKHRSRGVPEFVRTQEEKDAWKTRLPRPSNEGFQVKQLPTTAKKWLWLADLHSPYYSIKEFILALEYGKDQGCDGIGYLGDCTDMYMLSTFCKDPRERSLKDEADILKEIFDIANKVIQPKDCVWKLGNHEARLEKYVMLRTPELLGISGIEISAIFGTKERGIRIIPENDPLKHKSLTLIHGHEYRGGMVSPVNPARGMFLKANDCVVSAHLHKTSEHTEQTITGKIITCFSLGCLCGLHPKYAPLNKWNHGFGILETGTGEFWKFHNKRIIKGAVV